MEVYNIVSWSSYAETEEYNDNTLLHKYQSTTTIVSSLT